ncbi:MULTISPECIES: SCO family protein [unclassified Bacillus (in: firmicutes)]|uniref:SCO family protein n=1 Tax=unclassified Bacillus (in: firmicutes) TaxID=185979 RepID=UPI0008E56E0F|nr:MULTISPECIES: SCO family protein [unclassified Bacillus (in: firmicutes)]SFA91286.1 protein SCO1/2 [Bacillus sp. UNCCL13]SFQ85548.1 protein SCO1/2 [Bacillus sp. cl95]
MKNIYIICSSIVIIGILGGISFFLIRDASAQIPNDITLINQNNEEYQFSQNKKTVKLIEFIYTHCPDICPTTTQKMNDLKADLQKAGLFGNKVQFVTVSIDPYRDTPEVLRTYMNSFEIEDDGNWIFLTGDKEKMKEELRDVQKIADTFKFQYRDPGNGFYVHSTFTFLIDQNNKYIAKFPMGEDFNKNDVYDKILNELD